MKVLTKASYLDKSPPSWWLGTIVDQKQDLFLVQVNGKIKFENWFGVGLIRPPNPRYISTTKEGDKELGDEFKRKEKKTFN